jgi:hypothetical protein
MANRAGIRQDSFYSRKDANFNRKNRIKFKMDLIADCAGLRRFETQANSRRDAKAQSKPKTKNQKPRTKN